MKKEEREEDIYGIEEYHQGVPTLEIATLTMFLVVMGGKRVK